MQKGAWGVGHSTITNEAQAIQMHAHLRPGKSHIGQARARRWQQPATLGVFSQSPAKYDVKLAQILIYPVTTYISMGL
jgi:hypothetical protein